MSSGLTPEETARIADAVSVQFGAFTCTPHHESVEKIVEAALRLGIVKRETGGERMTRERLLEIARRELDMLEACAPPPADAHLEIRTTNLCAIPLDHWVGLAEPPVMNLGRRIVIEERVPCPTGWKEIAP